MRTPLTIYILSIIVFCSGITKGQSLVWTPPEYTDNSISSSLQSGNYLYFIANDGIHENEIWRTDGTESGTILIKDLEQESYASGLVNATSTHLFFWASTKPDYMQRLWVTDGTEQGTHQIDSYTPNQNFNTLQSIATENKIFFLSPIAYGLSSLWQSDGTNEGTFQIEATVSNNFLAELNNSLLYVKEFDENDYRLVSRTQEGVISQLESNGGYINKTTDKVYFSKYGTHPDLWVTNGAPESTKIVLPNVSVTKSVADKNRLFFITESNFKYTARITTGDQFNTTILKDNLFRIDQLIKVGEKFIFSEHAELGNSNTIRIWSSDGTPEGTQIILQGVKPYLYLIYNNGNDPTSFLFTDCDSNGDCFLMKHIINEGESEKVKILSKGNYYSTSIFNYTTWNNKLYFAWNDRAHGNEIWVSDGTAAGTKMVKDINKKPLDALIARYTKLNGKLLLTLYYTGFNVGPFYELWSFDPAKNQVDFLSKLAGPHASILREPNQTLKGNYYFVNYDKIWQTDGTLDGTFVKEDWNSLFGANANILGITREKLFFSGKESDNQYVEPVVFATEAIGEPEIIPLPSRNEVLHTDIFFDLERMYVFSKTANDKYKLRISDGTTEGTVVLDEFEIPYGWFFPASPVLFQGNLIFSQRLEGDLDPYKGWVFDGSELRDYSPPLLSWHEQFETDNEYYYIKSVEDSEYEIWKLKNDLSVEFYQSAPPGTPHIVGNIGDSLLIRIDSKDTYLLHGPTDLVSKLDVDLDFLIPNHIGYKDKLYFSNGSYNDYKLWVTDGSQENTSILDKIQGKGFSGEFEILNDTLYYAKPNSTGSSELWKLNLNPTEEQPTDPDPTDPELPEEPEEPEVPITGVLDKLETIHFSPNPATGQILVHTPDSNYSITITDLIGRVLIYSENNSRIEISFTSGVYLLHYISNSHRIVERITVK